MRIKDKKRIRILFPVTHSRSGAFNNSFTSIDNHFSYHSGIADEIMYAHLSIIKLNGDISRYWFVCSFLSF